MYNLVDIHFHTDDSFDAFQNKVFDVDKLINVLKDESADFEIKLLCKTDHNRFNFNKYYDMAQKFEAAGIKLLPGIEINAADNIHWLFIFDDAAVNVGIPENCDYHGKTLDEKINNYFGYDLSERNESLLRQAEKEQTKMHDIKSFIQILHELNIPYIAIPHLNKSKGWYEKLKKEEKQLSIVEEYLNSNIINGFESKNQDDFILEGIRQTEEHIKQFQEVYEKIDSTKNNVDKLQVQQEIQRRLDHLQKLTNLNGSITNGDVALIYGSDFHCKGNETMESYKTYKRQLFFIKAEPTFEGLRISLLDQYSRIFSYSRKEKYSKAAINCIDRIVLQEKDKEVIIKLGDGLNSIIGARGTGKSYLLNLLTGRTDKYFGSAISSDIQLKSVCFTNGTEKESLSSVDYDILTQRGTNDSSTQNENSIYGLLADAPFKMGAYLAEIKKLDSSPTQNFNIKPIIDEINVLIDLYIEIDQAKKNELNLTFFDLYNQYYNEQSDNIFLHDKFNDSNIYVQNEIAQIEELLEQVEIINNSTTAILTAFNKVEKQKLFSSIGIDFSLDKEVILQLKNDKITKVKSFYKNKLKFNRRILKIINSCIAEIRQSSTNTENTLTGNLSALNDFISLNLVKLRKAKKGTELLNNQVQSPIYDEEIYKINVGQQIYEIKTVSALNFIEFDQQTFEKFFYKYKIEFKHDIFVECFNPNLFGKVFIEKIYKNYDRRYKDYHFQIPELEKQLFLNFNDGIFKNWSTLSPGERADKLLDIVLDGDSSKILLIDQPEDDLDNETIYKTITRKIRDLKLRRQLIVVTHNANIAITGDSDRLIVCQNDSNCFSCYCDGIESKNLYSYESINSSLDDRKILLIAAEILDGGKEAIRKRVRKIGYKDIFYKEQNQ